MSKIIECVPNFSEGKDKGVIGEILKEIENVEGIDVWNVSTNESHNRTVVTFVGTPDKVKKAAINSALKAAELIDMGKHKGEHPRIGAADVIPFIPLVGASLEECIELANEVAKVLAERLNVPAYLYAEAAKRPELKDISYIQNIQFEGLGEKIKEEKYAPDYGIGEVNPKTGGVIVGARNILVAFNVNLGTTNLDIANKIAKEISEKSDGLMHVRAMGVNLEEQNAVQVSMNIIDYNKTPLYKPFELIKVEAKRWGVPIIGSYLTGLVPVDALVESCAYYLSLNEFSRDSIIENKLYK